MEAIQRVAAPAL
jgi:hypothetical protein